MKNNNIKALTDRQMCTAIAVIVISIIVIVVVKSCFLNPEVPEEELITGYNEQQQFEEHLRLADTVRMKPPNKSEQEAKYIFSKDGKVIYERELQNSWFPAHEVLVVNGFNSDLKLDEQGYYVWKRR